MSLPGESAKGCNKGYIVRTLSSGLLTPFNFFFNVCLFLRERETQSVSRGGAEKEGDTESEAGSRL